MAGRIRKRKLRNPAFQRPDHISLTYVETDDDGKIRLDFEDYRLKIFANDVVTVQHIALESRTLWNVKDRDQFVCVSLETPSRITLSEVRVAPFDPKLDPKLAWSIPEVNALSQEKEQGKVDYTTIHKVYFPNCKIGTLEELVRILKFMLFYTGLNIDVSYVTNVVTLSFPNDCNVVALDFDKRIAQSLGLIHVDGSISSLFQSRLPQGLTLKVEGERVSLLRDKSASSSSSFILPFEREHVIWNEVSVHSFQEVVVGLDILKPVFTGSEKSKTLITVPFDFQKTYFYYEPVWSDWKKLESGEYQSLELTFGNTRGEPFKKIPITILVKFRKDLEA